MASWKILQKDNNRVQVLDENDNVRKSLEPSATIQAESKRQIRIQDRSAGEFDFDIRELISTQLKE